MTSLVASIRAASCAAFTELLIETVATGHPFYSVSVLLHVHVPKLETPLHVQASGLCLVGYPCHPTNYP